MSNLSDLWFLLSTALGSILYAPWVALRGRGRWLRFERAVTIAAPPQCVFDLLHPAHPRSRYLLRGADVVTLDAREGRFRLIDPRLPQEPMLLLVTQEAARLCLAIASSPEAWAPNNPLLGTADRYDIEPTANGCRVALTANANFREDLGLFAFAFHELIFRRAIAADLKRLQAEAEALVAGRAMPRDTPTAPPP